MAVRDCIRLLESLRKAWVIKRDASDPLASKRAAHLHARRSMCIGEHRLLKAEPFKRAEDIGAELDAGADLSEFGRLFEHPHREAFACKRMRGREPTNAAAGNQDRQALTV